MSRHSCIYRLLAALLLASARNYFYCCASGLGVVSHTIGSPRQIQMSLSLTF